MSPQNEVGAWMKFYPQDWLASVTASGLTLAEQGAYVRLLCIGWEHGGIPADTKRLARSVGVSRQEFEEMWETLREKWEPHPDDPGRLINRRQEKVRAEQEARARKQAGWRERKQRQRDRGRDNERDTPRDNRVGLQDSGLRAQDSGSRTQDPGSGAKKRRSGPQELARAVSESGAGRALQEAMEAYRVRRVKRRHPVWETEQWLSVLREGQGDEVCLIEAFRKAEQSGWQSVHPKPSGGRRERVSSLDSLDQKLRDRGVIP